MACLHTRYCAERDRQEVAGRRQLLDRIERRYPAGTLHDFAQAFGDYREAQLRRLEKLDFDWEDYK